MFEDKVIPLDVWVSQFVDWLVDNYRDVFQALKWPVEQTLNSFDAGLNALSPLIVIAVLAFAAWKFSGKGLAIFTVITLTVIGLLGLWMETMTTLAMVLSSVIFCALVGVPLGIWAGGGRVTSFTTPALGNDTYFVIATGLLSEMANADKGFGLLAIGPEGTIGLAARRYCLRRGIPFTTAYHTQMPEYVRARFPIPMRWTYALFRWFHKPAARTMVPTESMRRRLVERGFENVVLWTRGVLTDVFHPDDAVVYELAEPVWVYFGRVAVEKNIEAFLDLSLPGSKVIIGDGPGGLSAALFLAKKGVTFTPDIAVLEIQGTLVKGLNVYSNEMIDFDGYDTVVLAAGNIAEDGMYFELKGKVNEIYRVGDCVAPRKTDMAIIEGHRVGRMI